ncbi:MAG: SPOR domain-containing protein [Salibacteraceae bacterium]
MRLFEKRYSFLIPCMIAVLSVFMTASDASAQETNENDSSEAEVWNFRPIIGVGGGMLNYQGDLVANRGYFNPFQNKLGLQLNVSQPITGFLDINFYMLFGELAADERTLVRNLNFKSQVTAGGFNVSYNFDHLLKSDRVIEPFVSVGFEAFEFLTKTDLIDQYGNPYNYWSDGTIRNLPEENIYLESAIEITRDYHYETDVRQLNADGLGNYAERSFAVPFGFGVNFMMNNKVSYQMGMEYHWTFTDYIDGITDESRGVRKGNPQTDKFLFTFLRLSYDLTPTPHEKAPDFSGADFGDSDLDSIPDMADLCPDTPLGVQVDSDGCPLDGDEDGIADYLDDELNSPKGSVVDVNGVALTDAMIEQLYLEYTDESGEYSQYTNESYSFETAERKTIRKKKKYSVKIGEFEEGVNDSLAGQLLSMPDVTTRVTEDGKTIIEVGNFENLPDAVQRKIDLESKGMATQDLIETSASGSETRVSNIEQDMVSREVSGLSVEEAVQKNKTLPPPKKLIKSKDQYTLDRPIDERSVTKASDETFGETTVYRIQIGAFANKLSTDIYDDIRDLLVMTTEDGLTRYFAGAFTNYEQAAARKIDFLSKGFDGAYVVPFRNGKRVDLESSGATPAQNVVPKSNESSANYGKVKFKVQVGAFKGDIPSDVLDKMMGLGRIDQREASDGTTKYLTGEFNNYDESKALKEQLISQGFPDASIVAEFDGKLMTAEEGIKLLK